MVPDRIVVLDAMPMTGSGKIDRLRLADWPLDAAGATDSAGPAPRTPGDAEGAVAAIWRDVLGVAEIDPDTNFFDAGGHSLALIQCQRGCVANSAATSTSITCSATRRFARWPAGCRVRRVVGRCRCRRRGRGRERIAVDSRDVAIIGMSAAVSARTTSSSSGACCSRARTASPARRRAAARARRAGRSARQSLLRRRTRVDS